MWSRVIPPSCDSSFIRQQAGMMPRMPPPRIERMYRMVCVALRLYYHSICGTQVRLGPYVFFMRQAFPIQAALAQRKSSRFRYVISYYRQLPPVYRSSTAPISPVPGNPTWLPQIRGSIRACPWTPNLPSRFDPVRFGGTDDHLVNARPDFAGARELLS